VVVDLLTHQEQSDLAVLVVAVKVVMELMYQQREL
jgi:hypothetical protein